MRKYLWLLFLIMIPSLSWSDTHTSAACNGSNDNAKVATAITEASNGDTVAIPAGDCTFASQVTINKNITVQGAGSGSTIINGHGFLISDSTDSVRITAIGTTSQAAGDSAYIQVGSSRSSTVTNFRIDHCAFALSRNVDYIYLRSPVNGVIDNNTFTGPSYNGIEPYLDSAGTTYGEWDSAIDFGSSDWVFVEDNTFDPGTTDGALQYLISWLGSKTVVRHNTFYESNTSGGWIYTPLDAHGLEGGSSPCTHSARATIIHDNDFIAQLGSHTPYLAVQIRGGTGLIYNNRFNYSGSNPWDTYIRLRSYRADAASNEYSACADISLTKDCATARGGEGYPCKEAPGQGVYGGTQEPFFIWGNTKSSNGSTWVAMNDVYVASAEQWAVTANRDYCVGSTQQASCNGISLSYTPYTYPHPLRGFDGQVSSPQVVPIHKPVVAPPMMPHR